MHSLPCIIVVQSIALRMDDAKNILSKRIKPLVNSLFRLLWSVLLCLSLSLNFGVYCQLITLFFVDFCCYFCFKSGCFCTVMLSGPVMFWCSSIWIVSGEFVCLFQLQKTKKLIAQTSTTQRHKLSFFCVFISIQSIWLLLMNFLLLFFRLFTLNRL